MCVSQPHCGRLPSTRRDFGIAFHSSMKWKDIPTFTAHLEVISAVQTEKKGTLHSHYMSNLNRRLSRLPGTKQRRKTERNRSHQSLDQLKEQFRDLSLVCGRGRAVFQSWTLDQQSHRSESWDKRVLRGWETGFWTAEPTSPPSLRRFGNYKIDGSRRRRRFKERSKSQAGQIFPKET